MSSSRAAVLLLVLALAACGGTARRQRRAATFAYDRSAPLRFQDRGRINHNYPIAIRDVSFASPKGGRVSGFLVVPPGRGRHPAVIYMHGSGGTRADFIPQAGWMAARGAVGLTLDSPFDRNTGSE